MTPPTSGWRNNSPSAGLNCGPAISSITGPKSSYPRSSLTVFTLENHEGAGHLDFVAQAQVRPADAALLEQRGERLRKLQIGPARTLVGDADVVPVDRKMDTRAHGFGKCFLGGKAFGEVVGGLGMRAEALIFIIDQDALGETVAEARERALDAADIDQVGAGAEDHARRASVISRRISRIAGSQPVNTACATIAWPMLSSAMPGMAAICPTLS